MAIREVATPTWRPEDDGDYGRHLAVHLLRKFKWLMLLGALVGGIVFGTMALFQPRVYSTTGSIFVDKSAGESQGMLTGLQLLGGNGGSLDNELQILRSRQIAWPVIEQLGLNLEIHDMQAPDSSIRSLQQRFGRVAALRGTREEQFTRLRVRDVHVSPELLSRVAYVIEGTAEGGWRVDNKRGRAGERVVLDHVSFTPSFGPSHEPGMQYTVIVKPAQLALRDYADSLGTEVRASVVYVSYRYHNPIVCTQVVNGVLDEFLASYERNQLTDFTVVNDFLATEIADREQRIDEIGAELTSYQSEEGVYLPSTQGGAAISALSALEQQRSANEIRLVNIGSVLRNWEQRSPEDIYESIQAPATDLPLEAGLVDRLASLITRHNLERQTKTDVHPDILSLRRNIDNQIGLLGDTLEGSRNALQTTSAELSREIAEQRGLLRRLPEAQSRIFMLESELQVNADILQNLQRSLTDTQFRQASAEREARILDPALPPVKRDAPSVSRSMVYGGFGGLIAMLLLALLAEASNRRLKSLREVRLGAGLPVLGVLPGPRLGKWVPVERNTLLLRRLAAFLQPESRPLGVVHLPEAGSSFELIWGLGGAAAEQGRHCLLIDADRLDMSLCEALNQPATLGLTDAGAGRVSPESVIAQLDEGRFLAFIGHGQLDARQLAGVLAQLRERFDSVIFALPPPLQWNGHEQLAELLTGGVVISMPQNSLRLDELQDAATDLIRDGMPLVGTVVTNYSSRRDILGRQELHFVAVPPGSRV